MRAFTRAVFLICLAALNLTPAQYPPPPPAVKPAIALPMYNGKVFLSGGLPTLQACGVLPSLTAMSRDNTGTINIGKPDAIKKEKEVTSCLLIFHSAFTEAPSCIVSGAVALAPSVATITRETALFTFTGAKNSGRIYYSCM